MFALGLIVPVTCTEAAFLRSFAQQINRVCCIIHIIIIIYSCAHAYAYINDNIYIYIYIYIYIL